MTEHKKKPIPVCVDLNRAGEALGIRRHSFGQGGFDDGPLTLPVVERVKALRPQTLRFFVQEYFRMMEAPGRYHWDTIDAMLKSVAATGATPILALCMKPACLFPKIDHTVTTPSSWEHWDNFISDMVRHFVRDLKMPGLWYEVGNEGNLGEPGGCPYLFTPDGYAEYYAHTVKAVLRADPSATVGGPALAGTPYEGNGGIIRALGAIAQRQNLPVDFVSWHTYNPDGERFTKDIREARKMLAGLGGPLASALTVIDEWNITCTLCLEMGEFIQASYIVDAVCRMLATGVDISNYYHIMDVTWSWDKFAPWTSAGSFQDLHDNLAVGYRGLHLLDQHGVSAASYVAFKLLYAMEGACIPVERPSRSLGTLASRTGGGCRLLVWNYHLEEALTEDVEICVTGMPEGPVKEKHYCLGDVNDFECVNAMRKGEMRLLHEAQHSGADLFKESIPVKPYSVHLITLDAGNG